MTISVEAAKEIIHDRHDHKLVENTHPPSWVNPTPRGKYNLVVVGAGTAGLVSAAAAAILGARVALIEKHLMGGDCLNYGCVPSKSLIASAGIAQAVRDASRFGFLADSFRELDLAAVMDRVREIRAGISQHDSAARFTNFGVEVFFGSARFLTPGSVEVEGQQLRFAKAIIATGARAAELNVPGAEEIGYLTNETVFSLPKPPNSLIVVGGGPIGCELGQAFRRLGTDVTVLSAAQRLLPRDDRDASHVLQEQFEREGVRVRFNARVVRLERHAAKKVVIFESNGIEEQVSADEILVAIGRTPNVEGLNLGAAGVQYSGKGIVVDDRLRTSNPRIFAVGDIASRFQFTHAAEALARIAVQNALFLGKKKASKLIIPWATFTHPEVAHVGMNEEQAQREKGRVRAITLKFSDNDRAETESDTAGFARFYVDQSGKIQGATLVGGHVGEIIGEVVLAMQKGVKVSELSSVIHPYPTRAEILKRLGDESLRSRLKPWMKGLLKSYFSWTR